MKITSIKDPIISGARDLQSSSKRKELGKAPLYGAQQIDCAIKISLNNTLSKIQSGCEKLLGVDYDR